MVAQSGGPTPVINSSLQGIIEAARGLDAVGTVYGARHGIEGVLKEELLDLSVQSAEEVSLLRFTPAAGSIGTCRYKLKAGQGEDFDRVIGGGKEEEKGTSLILGTRRGRIHSVNISDGRVALGGCPPRAPTDPYVLALEHTVPRITGSLHDGRPSGQSEPGEADIASGAD